MERFCDNRYNAIPGVTALVFVNLFTIESEKYQ